MRPVYTLLTILAVLVQPSLGTAQVQPVPMIQGGTSWRVWAAGQTAATVYSDLIDTAGMAVLEIYFQDASEACSTTGRIHVYAAGSSVGLGAGVDGMTLYAGPGWVAYAGAKTGNWGYMVGPPLPPFVKLEAVGLNDDFCNETSVYASLRPMPSQAVMVGPYEANAALPQLSDVALFPVLVGGLRHTGTAVDVMAFGPGGGVRVEGTGSASASPISATVTGSAGTRVRVCNTMTAHQLTTGSTTTITSPVDAGSWRITVQNLGNDEVLLSNNNVPTEVNAVRIQAGGDVWERDWIGDVYMRLKPTAATSPQVTPEDTRVIVCWY